MKIYYNIKLRVFTPLSQGNHFCYFKDNIPLKINKVFGLWKDRFFDKLVIGDV